MSIFRNDTVGSWTRGGQAIVHNVRMTTQVFFQTLLATLAIWVGCTLWYVFEQLADYQRYVVLKLIEAQVKAGVPGTGAPLLFRTPSGQNYWTSSTDLLVSRLARQTLHTAERHLIHGAILAGIFSLIVLAGAWLYFTRTGRGLGSNQYLRGGRFGSVRGLRRALRRYEPGSFTIGGIPIPAAFEPEHILLSGAPGTGKTNILTIMLEGIRKSERRAIVYDTAGTFVERFYRPGKDVILNPLDARTVKWTPWADVPQDYHYDQIAESVVPEMGKDPFWAKAARGTLVAVMRTLVHQDRMLVSVLLDILTRSGLKVLSAFVQNTEGSAFISPEGERTSAGIQAELASVLRGFRYLDDTDRGLSIREWVTNETDDGWLFITVKADQLPTLRPLITMWLDIAISAIMSMAPDQQRRLYCVIDELPSLQRLPSLSDFLARARKYGGCGILGFQSYPQLEAIYGIQEAAALTGYCSTWVALRANDTPTAKHVSENLGQVEQIEANEGMSYGVNDMRDGVNLSRMQVTRPLVMPTEIVNLPNLTGYLRFGRDLPVIRFTDRYSPGSDAEPAFVDRTSPPLRLGTVLADVGRVDEPRPEAPAASPQDVLPRLSVQKRFSLESNGKPAEPVSAEPPFPAAYPGLIGPRHGSGGSSIHQQSRPGGPWQRARPA